MKTVKLHESLALHLQDAGPLGRMIAHPLLYAIAYRPELNEQYNLQFLNKQDAAKKALKAGNWHTNIFLHERPYRLQALVSLSVVLETCNRVDEVAPMINEMLPLVYVDAEGLNTNRDLWRLLFGRYEGERNRDALPDTDRFMIYRGVSDATHTGGFSWTLDRKQAEWFAARWSKNGGHVFMREVTREEIEFYTDERSEKECVFFG